MVWSPLHFLPVLVYDSTRSIGARYTLNLASAVFRLGPKAEA